jgi:uncharacterized membrane protein YphA (DoxX/SURF4 family)
MKNGLGRYVFGVAAIAFGVFMIAFQEFNAWQQLGPLGSISHATQMILLNLAAAAQILGGLLLLWPKTAQTGAIMLACFYAFFALMWVPGILREPGVYGHYGSFFEEFSLISGAVVAYGMLRGDETGRKAARIGYFGFAISVVSFTLEQAFYMQGTASFVPKWIPPGQLFWAWATTIFFALGAIALLSGAMSLLAARLVTAMILGFGLLVWLPAPFAQPHQNISWCGNAQNTAILGAAWIVADYLAARRRVA